MMHAERAAFIQRIVDHPDDDPLRLVFADWLEEQGESERAHFIRLQCQLAAGNLSVIEKREITFQINDLLAEHQVAWQNELPIWEGIRWEGFDRGFVSTIRIESPRVFLDHAEEILRLAPIHTLNFHRLYSEETRELADQSALRGIRILDLEDGNRIGNAGLAALAGSPFISRLEVLKLRSNHIGLSGIRALGESKHLTNLMWLSLDRNELFDESMQLFAQSWQHPSLRILSLDATRLSSLGLEAFAQSPAFSSLDYLHLSSNFIDDQGLIAFANANRLTKLKALYFSYNRIGDAGIEALAKSEILKEIRYLYLRRNQIGRAGAEALAASPYLQRIEELNIGENRLAEGQDALRRRFGSKVWII